MPNNLKTISMKAISITLKYTAIIVAYLLVLFVFLPMLISYPSDIFVLVGIVIYPVIVASFFVYAYKEVKKYIN